MRTEQPWDWPPEQQQPPPRRTSTINLDLTIERQQRRRSLWVPAGRIAWRITTTVFVTAVCVVLSAVMGAAMWLLIVVLKAAAQ
jgi:hypothetical protein